MNSLLGVVVHFRPESVGVICDLEQMFQNDKPLGWDDPLPDDLKRR